MRQEVFEIVQKMDKDNIRNTDGPAVCAADYRT